ncbi:MAG TPA: aldolase/citrate lyase family protein [Kiritimatiellia bacterium]|nr:aldolase/citrate lyase family protein [Kiritimatiellia bacterium]
MTDHTLSDATLKPVLARLKAINAEFARIYPGEKPDRQPVQTVYGGAHLFKADTVVKLGQVSVRAFTEHAPDFIAFAKALQLPGADKLPTSASAKKALMAKVKKSPAKLRVNQPSVWLYATVYDRVLEKLKHEPVEDFRIDFEDGYGNRPDAEEDAQAIVAAKEVAKGMKQKTLPPFLGFRIKPLTQELKHRAIRTMDRFYTALLTETNGRMPENFVVTLPKVTMPEQVSAAVALLGLIEKKFKLAKGTLKVELMIETPQSILDPSGACNVPLLVRAADGRCAGAHFGVYDYTASNNITADHQHLDHPVCDFARHMMKTSLAGTGVWISDGATNIMPVGPHRAPAGKSLTAKQRKENEAVVHRAWRIMFAHVNHSLRHGYYQGWDLHPAQFPIRYAAVYLFFLEGLSLASVRLKTFVEKAAQATLIGDVFDDAATGQGLLNYFLRGINCGAITEQEALATGLTLDELHARSFVKILEARKMR